MAPEPESTPAPAPAPVSAWLTDLRFDWNEATQGARRQALAKGEPLFLEGQRCQAVYVVLTGRVLLSACASDGRERHLMIVGATGLVGDCAWYAADRHVLSAAGATDAASVAVVPLAQMRAALARHPHLQRQQQQMASLRFRIMLGQLALQASNCARRRIGCHLLGLMNSYGARHGQGMLIPIRFTQQEMGDICGLSRVSVSNTFNTLAREGVIGRSGALLWVRDVPRLARIAAGD